MKLHRSLAALLAALGLGLMTAALGVFAPVPSARGRAPARVTLDRAAEWGVWKARAGHVTSLGELAAELPRFVHRGRPSPASAHSHVPVVPYRPVQVRKPVLYLYASTAVSVRVRVGLPVGSETMHYPAATYREGGLLFAGQLTPVGHATRPAGHGSRAGRLRAAPRGHFWNDLRQVPASFFSNDRGETERFLFYDGLTDLITPFVFYGAGEHGSVGLRRGRAPVAGIEDVIFAVHGGTYRRVVPGASAPTPLTSGDSRPMRMLEGELREQLLARGLTAEEAQSLLATWHPDLVEATGDRRIYFVDRADYDRMLPLRISPRPRQLVRVGLVIELP